jgi:hypothetical protein
VKKITVITWILLTFASIQVYSQNAPIATIGTVSSYGSTAIVPVTASNFNNVGSWSLRITYDPALVTVASVASVTLGPLLEVPFASLDVNLQTSGQISMNYATYPGFTLSGNPVLVNIVFTKIVNGTSALTFVDNGISCSWFDGDFSSLNDVPYPAFYNNGSVTFSTQNSPVTTAPVKTACPGSLITIPVTVTGFLNIGSLSLTMHYDPAVLAYISGTNTSGFPGLACVGTTAGKVVIGGYNSSTSGTTKPDNTVLFTLTFNYLGGTTGLTWYDDGGSCEYTEPAPDFNPLNDIPQSTYFIDGSVSPAPALITGTTQVDVKCHGTFTGSIDLSVSGGASPYAYSWAGAGSVPATEDQSGLAAGIYFVTVTDANSCKATASATITEPELLAAWISAYTDVTNWGGNDGSLTMSASGGTTSYSYLWNNNLTSSSITGLTAGNYTVTVTDANSCTATASALITQPDMLCLKIKVFLQGPYKTTTHLMSDNLRTLGFIPVTEPYSDYPYNMSFTHAGTGGGETITNPESVFGVTGNDAIVDWVFIELRDKTDKTLVKYTRSALVQRDGDVVDVDGISNLCFTGLSDIQFYVAVRHRNHLGVMTASAKTLTSSGTVVDFTTGSEPEFNWGINSPVVHIPPYDYSGLSQSTLEDGKRAMWYGEGDNNGRVKYEAPNDDQSVLLTDVLMNPGNVTFQSGYDFCSGYYAGDIDMNGKVKYEAPDDDRSLILYQILFYPLNTSYQSAFDFVLEQLP